mmetsp:Transcript_4133/g.6073  ORF Transcript_4133/g.6073 Transcript_4133/m.6073 type:complete len:205 (+) Transcript_4133:163-777(+)
MESILSVLKRSLERSRDGKSRFVQLATIGLDGRPKCRTVVFRGFVDVGENGEGMAFTTNQLSQKVKEIEQVSKYVEIAWWFAEFNQQFRINGKILLISSSEKDERLQSLRQNQWDKTHDKGRQQFFWSTPPGTLLAESDRFEFIASQQLELVDNISQQPVPDTFTLLVLYPETLKYLCLDDNRSQIDVKATGSLKWDMQNISPL